MLGFGINILIAVGDGYEANLVAGTLKHLDFGHLIIVNHGEAALTVLEKSPPSFVIAAWELPGLGGLRLVKEFRKKRVVEPCLLIVPTYHESEINMAEGAGVDGFLPRPLSQETVGAKLLEILTAREEKWPWIMEFEADRLVDAGRPEDALEAYRGVLTTGQDRLAILHSSIGKILEKEGRFEEAVDHLEHAALARPDLGSMQSALGRGYLAVGRPQEAVRALERAVSLEPDNVETMAALADSLIETDQLARAMSLIQKLLTRHPQDLQLLNRKGIALRKMGKYQEAIDHYLAALRINDQDENLFFNLGRCYHETGRMAESVMALNQALNINPDFSPARKLLAMGPQK